MLTFGSYLVLASGNVSAHSVPAHQTWILAAILAATLLVLATEKIQKTVLVLISALLFGQQLFTIRQRDRAACFRAFLNNNWVGTAIFLGLLGHFALTGIY